MSDKLLKEFEKQGYCVAGGLFSLAEVAEMRDHYMAVRKTGPKPGDMGGDKTKGPNDPLNQFPRMINMHAWDEKTKVWMSDKRIIDICRTLVKDDVKLNQTMLYFKPPGARGQALHQDNQYIRHFPIIAAWVALDDCDEENGQMTMVPGSHEKGILPVERADLSVSFTNGQSVIPEGLKETGVQMKAGDVLFFGGFIIHGSHPNRTQDRFRRSFICHFEAVNVTPLPADPSTMMAALA